MVLDIVELIEKNPITKLSTDYNIRLLSKIKTNFTDFEQQLFLSSFYCYLNYHTINDFIIDLDDIWKWLDFTHKANAKNLLEKYFIINKDYTKSRDITTTQPFNEKKHGGQNINKYFVTIKCFKSFCLKAGTTKATEIHAYYMKLEEVLQETVEEECNELKKQLEQKDTTINELKQTAEQEKTLLIKDKQRAVELAIVNQFPVNTECIYFGTIDNTNENNELLIKFGHTNDLQNRVWNHHKTYNNFNLTNAFKVLNKVEIENLIKNDPKIKKHIRSIEINDKKKTEIIAYDTTYFTINKLSKYIQDIINSKTYSIDNFNRIIDENEKLTDENNLLKQQLHKYTETNHQQSLELNTLELKIIELEKIIATTDKEEQSVYTNVLLPEDELTTKFNEFIDTICVVRPDVEELSANIEGRYRLWSKLKPTKEIYHSLKNYLDIRFKQKKIDGHHGYIGVKLIPVVYKKRYKDLDVENFIFHVCKFTDTGKILNSVLLQEFNKWNLSLNKEVNINAIKEIKEYLNFSPYALNSTVWTSQGSNEGYYGISLKDEIYKPKYGSTTGKKVEKRAIESNVVISSWNTIADAALHENICKAKMSRNVKNKTIYNDYYYCVAET
jgi:hypothetical protein